MVEGAVFRAPFDLIHAGVILVNQNSLGSYLNDHLAGSVSALELIRHLSAIDSCQGMKEFLQRLHSEIEQDQETLRELIKELGLEESKVKQAASWVAEKIGRLKLHAAHEGDPALLLSLEGIGLGIMGKMALWESLEASDDRVAKNLDLNRLKARASEQYDAVKEQHGKIARKLWGGCGLHGERE